VRSVPCYVVKHAAHCLSVLVVSNVEPSLVHLLTVDQLPQQLLLVPVTSDHTDFVCCHSDVSVFSIAVLFLAATDSDTQKLYQLCKLFQIMYFYTFKPCVNCKQIQNVLQLHIAKEISICRK